MNDGRTLLSVLLPFLACLPAAARAPIEPLSDAMEGPPAPVERPTGPVESCATAECHTKVMSGRVLHGPTAQKRCDACHVVADVHKHTYGLIVPKSELCDYCHTQSERSVVHKPVTEKECEKCHDPHGSDYRLQLLGETSGSLCFPCHKPELHGSKEPIGDRAEMRGACNVCHESHSSWIPKLLRKQQHELCLSCHEELRSRLELMGRSHAPVVDGNCLDCHDAHTTVHPRQLRESTPQLCYSCHEHDNIKALVETSPFVHGAMTEKESCNACHVGHGSVRPSLLAGSEKGLCLSCHSEPLTTEDGRVLTDMALLFKENTRHHGPIRDEECGPCHAAHASPHSGLLTKEYPASFYATFGATTYALCFECHIENLAVAQQAIGVTEFRDMERNLHFVHTNKEKRGRTCRTCHEVHASSRPFHMRQTVPFGPRDWEIEINYTKLPNGGSCAPGCHETQSYDRGEGDMAKAPRAGLKPEMLE